MLDAAALLHGLRTEGIALGLQAGDVGGLGHHADAVAPEAFVGRQEDVGVGGLLLLFQAQAGIQLPGPAEQVGMVVVELDAGAGVGAGAGAEGEPLRRPLADTDDDRDGSRAVGIDLGRRTVDARLRRGEVGRGLQRGLQCIQALFAIGLAGVHDAVVAGDQLGFVELQALDAQGAETVARSGVVMGAQAGTVGFDVDRRLAVEQPGVGMVAGQQVGQHLLLGGIPVLLAEGLADRQGPFLAQLVTQRCVERAVDAQIEGGDAGARAGVETQAAGRRRRP